MADEALQKAVEKVEQEEKSEEGFWLFGYGSLIWKPPPHYDRRIPGYITGYVRRFWQASEDHRGTPSSPGRVVTLLERAYWETLDDNDSPEPTPRVWGTAYHIPHPYIETVMTYLDIREINGYSIHYADFHTSPSPSSPSLIPHTLIYIGQPTNPQFIGPETQDIAADIIRHSIGPSGTNTEYLFRLEESLEGLGPGAGDLYVSGLAEKVRELVRAGKEEGD